MRLVSELLRGTVTAMSDAPLTSFFDRYPDAGRVSIAGANGTAVLNVGGAPAGMASVSFGATNINLALDDASSGYLWSGTGVTAPPDATGFHTKVATPTEFEVLQGPDFSKVQPSSRISWQLSRPVSAGTAFGCQLDQTHPGTRLRLGADVCRLRRQHLGCTRGSSATLTARTQCWLLGDIHTIGQLSKRFSVDGREREHARSFDSLFRRRRVNQGNSGSWNAGVHFRHVDASA